MLVKWNKQINKNVLDFHVSQAYVANSWTLVEIHIIIALVWISVTRKLYSNDAIIGLHSISHRIVASVLDYLAWPIRTHANSLIDFRVSLSITLIQRNIMPQVFFSVRSTFCEIATGISDNCFRRMFDVISQLEAWKSHWVWHRFKVVVEFLSLINYFYFNCSIWTMCE